MYKRTCRTIVERNFDSHFISCMALSVPCAKLLKFFTKKVFSVIFEINEKVLLIL